jgi:hypothetical protein
MHKHSPTYDLVDDAVRFEVDFPVAVHTDAFEFNWIVASTGHLS